MTAFKEMTVYKRAFELSMQIFRLSKRFPREEQYSLTDQIRRSSRSVTAQFAEAYRRKRYPSHFVSKLTDADAENSETQEWLDYAVACEYVSRNEIDPLIDLSFEVGRMLGDMILHPGKYGALEK